MKNNVIYYSHQVIGNEDINEVVKALKSPFLTQGPKVEEFENKLKKLTRSQYALSVNSGTAALHTACMAIGLKKGDEVITSALSFVASSNCVLYCNALPVFADIDEYGLLSPSEVIKKITNKTKAIITIDYSGLPSHISELKKICKKNNLYLIQDASHSLGATFQNKPVGSFADITTFSFHPVKSITTAEGGAITTNNLKLYKKMKILRTHGITKDKNELIKQAKNPWYYEMNALGYNYRMSDIHAALGVSQLKKLKKFIDRRRAIAVKYNKAFASLERSGHLITPKEYQDSQSAWHLYPLRINFNKINKSKRQIFKEFAVNGIALQVHYIPIYKHPYYVQNLPQKDIFSNTESYYNQEVSLPLYPSLSNQQINQVITAVKKIIR